MPPTQGGAETDGEEVVCFIQGGKGSRDLGVDLRWCPDQHSAEKGREVVLVSAVHEGGSCALAGIAPGDVLLKINDKPLQVRRRAAWARGALEGSRAFTKSVPPALAGAGDQRLIRSGRGSRASAPCLTPALPRSRTPSRVNRPPSHHRRCSRTAPTSPGARSATCTP